MSKSKRNVAALCCIILGVVGLFYYLRKPDAPPIILQLWQTESNNSMSGWAALAAAFHKQHPDISIEVSYAPAFDAQARSFDAMVSDTETLKAHAMAAQPLFESNYQVLFYNKNLAAAAPLTWESMAKAALVHTKPVENRYGLAMSEDIFSAYPLFAQALLSSQDVASKARMGFESLDLVRFTYPVTPMGCHASCAARLFTEGRAAFAIASDWRWPHFHAALGDRLGIAALPEKASSAKHTYMIGAAKGLSGTRLEAYQKFAQFLDGETGQQLVFEMLHKIPSRASTGQVQLMNPIAIALNHAGKHALALPKAQYNGHLALLAPIVQSFQKGQLTTAEAATLLLEALNTQG